MSVFKGFSKKAQFGGVLALAGFSACSSNHSSSINARQGIDPQPAVSAAMNVTDSLGSAKAAAALPGGLSAGNQDQVIIQKTALDKEFLFSGSVIPQTQAATSHGIASRVVMFRRVGAKVFMLEATQGQVVSPALPSTLILASFPILSESSVALVIDFNKGMNQIFTDGDMYASDESGLTYQPTFNAEAISQSYLESVQVVGNILEVRQAAQVPESTPAPDGAPAGTPATMSSNGYEFRYYLEPYHPNPSFTPIEIKPNDFHHVGFFEVNPVVESITGKSITRVAMRDLSKPVVYAVSANTPPELHDAVRDGVLYWNKVFGREVVKVIDAPAGVTAPDPQYNVIQWVENDSAGFAYADVLSDPRSGEILHSQVYLTSVFNTGTLQEMPGVMREYKPAAPKSFEKGLFASSRVCDRGVDPGAASAMLDVKAQGPVAQGAYNKVVRDYIQFVVTHEVGHTLGLRHNFAGSLASTATPDQTDQMFSDYINKGTVPAKGQIFASSVMDYNVLAEDVLHVAMFNSQNLVLPYDQMAINWAYAAKPIDDSSTTLPPYCSDAEAEKVADCLTFDRGAKPIVANQQSTNKTLRLAGFSLAEMYINAKAPADPRDGLPFMEVPLDPTATVKSLMTNLASQISWLKSEGNLSAAVLNMFPFVNDFYKSDIFSDTDKSVAEQVGEAGGVEKILAPLILDKIDPKADLVAITNSELATYLDRDDVKNGTGANGKPYSLTDSDIALMKYNGQKFFQEVVDLSFDGSLALLAKGVYTNKKLAPEMEATLGNIATLVILDPTKEIVAPAIVPSPTPSASPSPAASGAPAQAKGPVSRPAYAFKFSLAQREAATQLLNASLGGKNTEWNIETRKKVLAGLLSYITSVVGQDPTKIDATTLSEPMRGWFTDEMNVAEQVAASAQR
jgi:hypothetical protein